MLRSILAVVVGYLVMYIAIGVLFLVWFGGYDPQNPPTPSMGFMLFSLVYGFVFAGAGGYVCALIAKRAEMNHAMALAGLVIVLAVISMIAAAGREPLWYQLAGFVIGVGGVLIGGLVHAGKAGKSSA